MDSGDLISQVVMERLAIFGDATTPPPEDAMATGGLMDGEEDLAMSHTPSSQPHSLTSSQPPSLTPSQPHSLGSLAGTYIHCTCVREESVLISVIHCKARKHGILGSSVQQGNRASLV